MTFEIEITRFEPEPVTSRTTTTSASDAELVVRTNAGETCVVLVAHHDGGISRGEFYI